MDQIDLNLDFSKSVNKKIKCGIMLIFYPLLNKV